MLFWIKKAVSFWLMPLPLCLALLIAGALLPIAGGTSRRLRRIGGGLVGAAVLLLAVFSNRGVSYRLVTSLESRFPPQPEWVPGLPPPPGLAACRFVVVLGSGHAEREDTAATTLLVPSGLARLAEAVRIIRQLPGARLIVSGPGRPGYRTHASVLAQAAASLGVDPARITQVDYAHDTREEALAVRALAGDAPVALVTSAWHMPRADGLFVKAGVHAVPCPVDFSSLSVNGYGWDSLGWDTESLMRSTQAVHERIGLAWSRLRGQID